MTSDLHVLLLCSTIFPFPPSLVLRILCTYVYIFIFASSLELEVRRRTIIINVLPIFLPISQEASSHPPSSDPNRDE